MGEHWRDRGTDGQEKASPVERGQRDSGARGQGRVRDPSGDGRGGRGERSIGDVDGRGTPVGWDKGQRDREKCSKRCPGTGRRAAGCPRGQGVPEDRVSLSPGVGGGALEGGRKLCPGSDRGHPDVPALLQPPATQPQEWLWAVSPTVSPCPCHPVPYTCPCVPTSPPHVPIPVRVYLCPTRVPMPPRPLPHTCPSAGGCMPRACP